MVAPIIINLAAPVRAAGRRRGTALAFAGVVVLLVSLLNTGVYIQAEREGAELRAKLAARERQLRVVAVERKSTPADQGRESLLKAQVQLVDRLIREDAYPWNHLLRELEELLPEQVFLDEFSAAGIGGPLILKGHAGGVEAISNWLQRLEGSTRFGSPTLAKLSVPEVSPERPREVQTVHFEIRCELISE
jgi:Tfp pilus assembly protein PilN